MRKKIYIKVEKKNLYSVKVEKFFTVKSWKQKMKKISFINLFGHEVKKIIFLDFTSCKIEENKFL